MSAGLFEASFLQGLDDLMTIVRSGAEGNVDYELRPRGAELFRNAAAVRRLAEFC